ncbi:MAG: hypothetical protein ACK4N5_16340, partial [Myxococcales bacterium]
MLLVVGGLFAAGCSPGIHITRFKPSRYNLGGSRSVAVVHVEGPPEATGVVHAELADGINRGRFYTHHRNVPAQVHMVVPPGSNQVANIDEIRAITPGDVYIRAHVTRWFF